MAGSQDTESEKSCLVRRAMQRFLGWERKKLKWETHVSIQSQTLVTDLFPFSQAHGSKNIPLGVGGNQNVGSSHLPPTLIAQRD
jgi:hypothetical protein